MSAYPPLTPSGGSDGPLYLDGWDYGELGGVAIPGKCRVTGGRIRLKCDRKSKNGADGANPTFRGLDPQEFQLEIVVWTQEQLDALYAICRALLPRAGIASDPVVLNHPDVRHMGDVVSVQVIGANVLQREGMMRKLDMYLLHRLPTKKRDATNTPKGSPVRGPRNKRSEVDNPPPTNQSIGDPPLNYTPGV